MLIDYQNVSIYQADKCVLQNINFHIDEGEFAYLIGKVGSGKSSLLKTPAATRPHRSQEL